MNRIHAYVSGVVQGVFFRYSTKRKALELNVVGFAKNLDDGRVEVIAEGQENKLKELIAYLHTGPTYAHVTNVEVVWEEPTHEFESFSTR